ncbi:MAG: extracellular solute-binding protein [Defluviitaleaceae bacterium]|nr:extracellular solute-binding protein [Defluviitaleaceae bacterium]
MKKHFIKASVLAVVFVCALFLQACGDNAGQEQAAATVQETAAETEAPATQDPAPEATGGTVVLYSNAVSDGRGEWIQERALAELGIDVQLVDLGGVALANRLIAERYNPLGDVVFGLNPMLWVAMEENELLAPYVPAWASEVPANLHHANGLFHAVILVGNLLVYDLGQLSPEDAPTDWLDIWQQPHFHGRYALPNALTGSTVQMVLSGIFGRYLDPDGFLGVSDEGWAQIEGKFRYGVVVPTGLDIFTDIVDPASDVVMSQMWSHGIPFREEQFDIEVGFVVPSVGVPFSIEGVALINGAANEEAAMRFIDWFGTSEVMHDFSYEFGFLPAHPDALDGLSGITLDMAVVPHQNIDWVTVSANIGEWMEHIYLTYMQ